MALRSDNVVTFLGSPGRTYSHQSGRSYIANDQGAVEVPWLDSVSMADVGSRLNEIVNSGLAEDLKLISEYSPDVTLPLGYMALVAGIACFWTGSPSPAVPSGWIDQNGLDAVVDLG
jgi:hypothetical protein